MITPLAAELEQEADPARRLDIIERELRPTEPQLLDTCILQNLNWVDRRIESGSSIAWDEGAVADLATRYGADLASDLIDLRTLYKEFEHRSDYPWLVSGTAQRGVGLADGVKGARLSSALAFFRSHQDEWCGDAYRGLAKGLLFPSRAIRLSPLLLRGLGLSSVEEIHSATGPLSFLPGKGDRMLATEALIASVPVLVTTDRATFWRHRAALAAFGLTVMRPTELLTLYEPYWEALDDEFVRRRDVRR